MTKVTVMIFSSYDRLVQLLQGFISGQNQSLEYVNKIEGLLIGDFRDDEEIFDELSEAVARYRPGGGEQLYDETNLTKVFKDFLYARNHEIAI